MSRTHVLAALLAAGLGVVAALAMAKPNRPPAWLARLETLAQPCGEARDAAFALHEDMTAGRVSLNRMKASADVMVEACASAERSWRAVDGLPPRAADACLKLAAARTALARDLRADLDRPGAGPSKQAWQEAQRLNLACHRARD